ncbi:MAG: hypothetical protein KKD39_03935 [Candidatus Altiarchaeota archaeon]|nr:hypothetical protein [Candidatus Altiarchaeota archaeon]
MVGSRNALMILSILLFFTLSVSAWEYSEDKLKGCLCYYSCGELGGWDCSSVWCGYDPKSSTASPACADLSGGPCRCEGFGCGRTQMITTGRNFERCMEENAKPVCGDGKCENRKDENCQNCARDCGCFSSAECSGKDPKDERGCTDKCAGIECKSKCEGNKLYTAGKCNPATKSCDYKITDCKTGCDAYSGRCKDEDDKCRGVVCEGECDWRGIKWEGICNQSSGQCVYSKNATCPQGCIGKDKCVGRIPGEVYYTDTTKNPQGEKVPIRRAKVYIEYFDKDGTKHSARNFDDPEYTVWTDDYGKFTWNYAPGFDPSGKINIALIFDNQKKKLYVANKDSPNDPWGIYFDKDIHVTDKKLKYADMDLTKTPIANNDRLKGVGKIYANMLRAAEWKENTLRKGDTVRERTLAYSNFGTSHLAEIWVAEAPDETGTRIKWTDSDFSAFEAPTNREFHEYCHHIHSEVKTVKRNAVGQNHGGYFVNPDTEQGLIEGWAEYCALMMKKDYGMGKNGDYEVEGNTVWNLEANYKIDDPTQPVTAEELAIAGILLDLSDYNGDYGGPDDDAVSIWPIQVWNAMKTKRDFKDGDGERLVRKIRDLYIVLNSSGIRQLNEVQPGMNISKLDYVFLLHNAFQDRNNNSKWDTGEEFGFSGKFRNFRKDLEYEPGTEVLIEAKDPSGKQVLNTYVKLEINYSEPYKHLSRTHYIPVQDGKIAIPMAPQGYNVTYTVSVLQGGTENTGKDKYTITNKVVHEKINPKKPLGMLSTTIKTTPVACKTDNECRYWLAGDKCSNKTNTCEGMQGMPKPEEIECGKNIRCIGEKEGIIGGLTPQNLPCCSFLMSLPLISVMASLFKKIII